MSAPFEATPEAHFGPMPLEALFRLGSLWVSVACERAWYRDEILAIFRATAEREAAPAGEDLLVVQIIEGVDGIGTVGPDQLIETGPLGDGSRTIATEVFAARLVPGRHARAHIVVRRSELDEYAMRVHLSVVFHRLLFHLGRTFLHAGGVRIGERTIALVGGKGAGKSTVSLRLGAAGAIVLADDHLVVRRSGFHFTVSGCDRTARVLPDAEHHLFGAEIDAPIVELGGVRKKAVRVADFCESDPFREHRLDRLVFQRVGQRLRLEPLSAQQALLTLIEATRRSHRFSGPTERAAYVDLLSDLVEAVPSFSLELTPALSDLDRAILLLLDG